MSSEKRKTILLVEDEAILALSGKITLGKIGYNILIANTGEKAVKMIETMSSENPIDLILMDIDLGAGISGPEAAVQILKDRTIPIVFHTSHAEREMVETVRGITRYGYVIKNSGDFVLQSSIEMAFELFDSHKQLLNELKERQLAQDALKKSEEKFYKAFEASPNAIAISSLDTGIYIDVNEAFLTMTGYKKDEIIGHTSTEIEIWADITEREKFINKLVQDGYLRNFEASYRMKNKEVKDFLVSSETIELEGKHCGINFILDITESKQAEIKLRNAAVETQRLRIALDYVSAHIYMKDSKFRYIYANQSTLELFGCSAGELINCDDSCFFPPETVAQLRKIDARVLQGEQTTEEIVVKDDSGKQQIFWEIKTPIYADTQNKTILGLLGISTDITSRKKVEEDLIESKKQYENLVSKIPVGIYIFHTKPDGSFLFDYISPGIAALFNISVDSFFADVRLIFKLVHPEDLESFVKLNNEGLELLRPFDWKGRILANGTVKWVHFTSTPELQENGDVLWHGLVVDISESKIAEEKINTLLKEKELLLKEVHHRIKNNMNTINSLFTLQADTLKDQAAIDALQDAASPSEA